MIKNLLLLIFLSFFCLSCTSKEEITFLKPTDSISLPKENKFLKIFDLNGEWNYSTSANENSESAKWQTVQIPSSYEGEGRVVFRKVFNFNSNLSGKQISLTALGINYKAIVKLNGDLVGNHLGGYTSFKIEIDPNLLKFGEENILEIEVDNTLDIQNTLPLKHQIWGWKNYGGIFREIYFEITPQISINNLSVKTEFPKSLNNSEVGFSFVIKKSNFQIVNSANPTLDKVSVDYFVEISEPDSFNTLVSFSGKSEFEINEISKIKGKFDFSNPKLWELNNPNLYNLTVKIMKDSALINQISEKIGFKEALVQNSSIFLNRNPLKIQGLVYLEEENGYGNSVPKSTFNKDVLKIKSMGCNVIYTMFPPHPNFIDLCNQYGILVIEQIPLWSIPNSLFAQKYYFELTSNYFSEMIERDLNEVSILAWSLGGRFETLSETTYEFAESLIRDAKAMDSRPIASQVSSDSSDPITSIVDLPILNMQFTEISEISAKLTTWKSSFPEKPLVTFDYPYLPENDTNLKTRDENKPEYQAKAILEFLREVEEMESSGSFIAPYAEWKADEPFLTNGGVQQAKSISFRGILDYNRKPKKAFEVITAKFTKNRPPFVSTELSVNETNYTFPLFGILIIFVLGFMFRTNTRFRENLMRSVNHIKVIFFEIHNNRVSVYDYLYQQLFLIAATLSLTITGYIFTLRRSPQLDYWLSQVFTEEATKALAVSIVWEPILCFLILSTISFLFFILISLLLSLSSYIFRANLTFRQVASVMVWSGTFIIFLAPISMFLPQIIGNNWIDSQEISFYVVTGIYLIFFIGYFFRVGDGIAIAFSNESKVFQAVFAVISISIISYLVWYSLDSLGIISSYGLLNFVVNG
ncbi:MAG: hypothetical protein DWQ06_02005 [Calditrichaeota bacterium]|nr:MAG: hypothetical protein DWQ06_02005 [Calditrichota bacterium]